MSVKGDYDALNDGILQHNRRTHKRMVIPPSRKYGYQSGDLEESITNNGDDIKALNRHNITPREFVRSQKARYNVETEN